MLTAAPHAQLLALWPRFLAWLQRLRLLHHASELRCHAMYQFIFRLSQRAPATVPEQSRAPFTATALTLASALTLHVTFLELLRTCKQPIRRRACWHGTCASKPGHWPVTTMAMWNVYMDCSMHWGAELVRHCELII